MNFKDLIQLCGDNSGKIFVVDDSGDVKLVVLSGAEFQNLLGNKLAEQAEDIEDINQEILKAQLTEQEPEVVGPLVKSNGRLAVDLRSEVIDPTFDFDSPIEIDTL